MWGGNDMTQSQWENTAMDDGAEMRKRIVALTRRKKWLCNRLISPQRRKRRQRLPSDPLRFRVTPLKSLSLAWKKITRSRSHSVGNLVELNSWGTEEFSRLAWGQNERKWKGVEAFCGNTGHWGRLASNQRPLGSSPGWPSPSHVLPWLLRGRGGRRQALGCLLGLLRRVLHWVPEQPLGRLSWVHRERERDRKSRLLQHLQLDQAWANYGLGGHMRTVKLFNPACWTWRNVINSKKLIK